MWNHQQIPKPQAQFNPCFCCTNWDLRHATIYVAIFSFFLHTGIMVVGFGLYIYYPDKMIDGEGISTFRIACLIVGIVSACLIPSAILIFIGAVKYNLKLCYIWLVIITISTFADLAGIIVERTLGIVAFEVCFFVGRAYNIWVVASFVIELRRKNLETKIENLRRSLSFASIHSEGGGGGEALSQSHQPQSATRITTSTEIDKTEKQEPPSISESEV